MPTISVEIMVSTKITRFMELEISSPDMRSTEVPEHIQKYLLRDDEVLERTRIISTDPRLPNINLGDPKLEKIISERKPASHNLVFDQPLHNPVKANLETPLSPKQISFTPSPYNAAKNVPEWLPRAQEEQYRRLPMSDHTGSSANSDAPPSSSADEELLPSPVKFKSAHKRRSASDGDVLRSVNVRDFAFDRNAGKKDPLKTPSKPRTVHAKIMKSRSPTKEERFQAQVKLYGLPTALKMKEKRDNQDRGEFVKNAGIGRWKSTEKSDRAKISAITSMLESNLYVNEKGKAYDISDDDSEVAHHKLMEEDSELEKSLLSY